MPLGFVEWHDALLVMHKRMPQSDGVSPHHLELLNFSMQFQKMLPKLRSTLISIRQPTKAAALPASCVALRCE